MELELRLRKEQDEYNEKVVKRHQARHEARQNKKNKKQKGNQPYNQDNDIDTLDLF